MNPDEPRTDAQEARDDRDEARDDRDEARDDRAEARDERAGFTRDDLDVTAVQVDALRQDLAAYRWAIEKVLRRRMWTSVVAAVASVGVLIAMGLGALALLDAEEERAQQTLEIARLESCAATRVLQSQMVGILTDLQPITQQQEWLGRALERMTVDPCAGNVGADEEG